MDYCHACRRHLNGALACAGCGTPAEELRHETPRASAPGRGPATAPAPVPAPAAAPEHVYELDVVEPPRPPVGGRRAARTAARGRSTRRGRRSRTRRGRTVLLGTVGLVLAAGTLSMAKLALEEPPRGGAATAVQELEVTGVPLPPDPVESTGAPDGSGPDPVTHAPESASTRPHRVAAGSTTGAGGGPGTGVGTGAGTGPGAGGSHGERGAAAGADLPRRADAGRGATRAPPGAGAAGGPARCEG
ncbi:hypothetical protein ACFUJ0_24170, partial [Streptomyces sp. NPDC057242]|uniref:SCO2400 family protein n=1 Tax=Streptomyces sp. NPDC057242 TaxID=3346063 RepID=UPI0036457AFA